MSSPDDPAPNSADRILASAFERVRLARGVVGKAGYVAVAAVFGLSVVAYKLDNPYYLMILSVLMVIIFILYFAGALWFANKHPGVSLLEGADLIQWRQMEMASKSDSVIDGTTNTLVSADNRDYA